MQVGGWSQSFGAFRDGKNITYLTYATVRGAAHEVPYTTPSPALTLFQSFLTGSPLPNRPKNWYLGRAQIAWADFPLHFLHYFPGNCTLNLNNYVQTWNCHWMCGKRMLQAEISCIWIVLILLHLHDFFFLFFYILLVTIKVTKVSL